MICVYSRDCTDFTTNGLGAVTPISATVTETLNGEYELQLEHPIDAAGKWRRLTEGCILRVPVPAGFTPAVQVREQTSQTETDIYAVIDAVTSSLYLWGSCPTEYPVRYGKAIWSYRARTEVAVLSKADAPWFEVIGPDGKHGWMYGPYMRYVRTETSGEEAEAEIKDAQALREQPFRVYRVVPELDKITVYARHVFYDLLDNMIQSYAPSATDTGADAARGLSQACLSAHDFAFYSDLTSTAEDVSYVNVNPVEAIMGSDGLLTKYGGELTRDWWCISWAGSAPTAASRSGRPRTCWASSTTWI